MSLRLTNDAMTDPDDQGSEEMDLDGEDWMDRLPEALAAIIDPPVGEGDESDWSETSAPMAPPSPNLISPRGDPDGVHQAAPPSPPRHGAGASLGWPGRGVSWMGGRRPPLVRLLHACLAPEPPRRQEVDSLPSHLMTGNLTHNSLNTDRNVKFCSFIILEDLSAAKAGRPGAFEQSPSRSDCSARQAKHQRATDVILGSLPVMGSRERLTSNIWYGCRATFIPSPISS
jgi:hypothetical protein